MADTTYNSLGVDEVAAQHVNAQCVVGNVCTVCLYVHASVQPASLMRPFGCLIGHWYVYFIDSFLSCQIHYGRASLSPLSKLPAYFVFTRQPLDCPRTSQRIVEWASQARMVKSRKALVLLPDQALAWALQGLSACLTADLEKVIPYHRALSAGKTEFARHFIAASCQPTNSRLACECGMGAYRLLTRALPGLCEQPPIATGSALRSS